jgi:hypothetical protein
LAAFAGGRDADEQAAGPSECNVELCEFKVGIDVIGDGGSQRWKADERDAGDSLLTLVGKLRAESGALFRRELAA